MARKHLTNRWGKPFQPEVVFFDVGGTLVFSNMGHLDLLHQALVVIGYKVARDEVVEANEHARRAVARRRRRLAARMDINEASRMWLEHLAEGLKLDLLGADLEVELTWAIREIESKGEVTVDPDACGLLTDLLDRGMRLGVISNWAADLPEYLAARDLAKFFEVIIASEAVGTSKPHREIFLRGLAAMGASPEQAVHIGDDYWTDVVGARGIGMAAVLLDRDREAVHSDCPTVTRLRDFELLL